MRMPDDFAVFILTHGRPERVVTYNSLMKQGYEGRLYIVIDNEDKMADAYREKFGDKVIKFDKLAVSKTFDTGDNFDDRRTIIYARNACFQIAKDLKVRYFLQLDDDYSGFYFKFDADLSYKETPIKDVNPVFRLMLDYYKSIPALTIAFGQNGDFIGGAQSGVAQKIAIKRKCMNTFFCDTERPFQFVGRINEDVNTYTSRGVRGDLLFTVFSVAIIQQQTQTNKGGMTNVYLNEGTYIKSFYSVMYSPSCTTIRDMGHTQRRIHHRIAWDNCEAKILDPKWKKGGA